MSTDLAPFACATAVLPFSRRTLIYGPPSTGKSYLAHRSGLADGQRVFSTSCQEDGSTADLLGCWILKDKEMVWTHGVGIMAWLEGARLVVDEIDKASPEVRSFFHRLCDDPDFAQIKLPSGEVVRPAPGFQIVATMNGTPDDLPEALRSRFPVTIEVTTANPEAVQALPEDLQAMAHKTATHADETRRVHLRTWYAFAELREKVGLEVAAQACFAHRAHEILDSLAIARKPVTARK